ncbi:MAG: hypothetical protein GDA50_02195 [Alphaproteobacteria bacterium GM202ARS2]|nr:hypothetical protein [Alphaproteobacteria bacterium GM202ARS2]
MTPVPAPAFLFLTMVRFFTALFLFLFVFVCGVFSVRAQTSETSYVVPDVIVNLAAGSVESARREALLKTRADAFYRLLHALTLKEDHSRLPQLASSDVRLFAEGVDVDEEGFTQDSYYAKMSWRYDKKLIRELLEHLNIPFVGGFVGRVVILPIYTQAGISILWDDSNPWLGAWRQLPVLSPFYSPYIPETGPSLPSSRDGRYFDSLARLAADQKAQRLVIAIAQPTFDKKGQMNLLNIEGGEYQFPSRLPPDYFSLFISRQPKESEEQMLTRAAEKTRDYLEQRWKERNLVRFDEEKIVGDIVIKVLYGGFADWVAIKKSLQQNAAIGNMKVATLSRDHAIVEASVATSIDNLQRQFAQQGLTLTYDDDQKTWLLRGNTSP